ncbi:hypothetical protein [Dictyobacter kobayashii]|uniref:Uncharacterized protein n=1 Tax=Dictyobacter kobayashii TaxID=2014872 RepID=A0A402ATG8_9CHLR|nr:hypothetical protein [Dictyobacter kobayashii]GCE22408.1 hypothetical protein KDK_62080 [Dictyobacter kobayashii]
MFIDRLYYEWKLHWKPLLLAPVVLMLACMLFALLQSSWKENIGRTYLGFAEVFLPLAAGVIAGSIVVREPALELHLTVAQAYRKTVLQRMLLLILAYACVCCLLISSMSLQHFWFLPRYLLAWPLVAQWFISQLIWLAL